MLLKNISSIITVAKFTYVHVFCISSSVSDGLEKCCSVRYTSKHGVTHKSTLHSGHLNCILVSLLSAEHTWQ